MNLISAICTYEKFPVKYCQLFDGDLTPDIIRSFINSFNKEWGDKISDSYRIKESDIEICCNRNILKDELIFDTSNEICLQVYNNVDIIGKDN